MTRPAALFIAVCTLAVLAAGCGGSKVEFTEVSSDPVTLPIPRDENALAAAEANADDATDPDATATPDSTTATAPTDSSTSTTTTTAPPTTTDTTTAPTTPTDPVTTTPDDGSGGAAPPTDDTTDDTSTGGSGGATFGDEQFCADNPGAC